MQPHISACIIKIVYVLFFFLLALFIESRIYEIVSDFSLSFSVPPVAHHMCVSFALLFLSSFLLLSHRPAMYNFMVRVTTYFGLWLPFIFSFVAYYFGWTRCFRMQQVYGGYLFYKKLKTKKTHRNMLNAEMKRCSNGKKKWER